MVKRNSRRHTHPTENWVVNALKELILERGLQSGDLLPPETVLMELLDVSRSSIREAIKVLSTLDIVEVRHGTGTYVSNMSLKPMVQSLIFRAALTPSGGLMALGDVIELRAHLDDAYAPQIVKKLAGKEHPDLHALVDRMEKYADCAEKFREADREFHKLLAKKANNLLLLQLMDAFWDIEDVVIPKLPTDSLENNKDVGIHHRLLLEAAEEGNLRLYRKRLKEHYAPLRARLPHPDYFPDEE
ncbi:FadR/GntR family transcriptional regulator [Arcanobacterium buesumense]|uniref:FadR family transcriptional regulator n=1 Tax=Arcanobacterium buesumense TaxID=2722751 RepID=A0A6H2EK31_9ACTO|nr:FCD domain-containing protein [Arcanobacterium buesumense]QJC21333.1 FadR family transcriptional regulator [Arcanobacterium buesumense]